MVNKQESIIHMLALANRLNNIVVEMQVRKSSRCWLVVIRHAKPSPSNSLTRHADTSAHPALTRANY